MTYINVDEVREIRNELKYRFGRQLKFSVKNVNNSRVSVTIKSGNIDFSDLLNGEGRVGINEYNTQKYGKHKKTFDEIFDIIKTAPGRAPGGRVWYNNSDSMTDYFDTAFYFELKIGDYNKPYQFTGKKKVQTQIINDNWKTDLNPKEFDFMPLDSTNDSMNHVFTHLLKTSQIHDLLKRNYTITATHFSRERVNLLESIGVDYAVTENIWENELVLNDINLGEHQIVIDSHDLDKVLHAIKEERDLVASDDLSPPDPEDLVGFI